MASSYMERAIARITPQERAQTLKDLKKISTLARRRERGIKCVTKTKTHYIGKTFQTICRGRLISKDAKVCFIGA